MYSKELREARGKFIIFAILIVITTISNMVSYLLTPSENTSMLPTPLASQMQHTLSSFQIYSWSNWFQVSGAIYLTLFAAILGTSLIAGEVSKGSIYFLLCKPMSRDHVLLTKYGVSALLMLIIELIGMLLIFAVGTISGHPLDLLRMLLASLLSWLGALFVLGLTLIFSVLFNDILRPALIAMAVTAVLALLAFLPNWQNWSLITYWSSADAYFKGAFPLTNLLVNLVAAVLPLIIALVLFRKKAY